MPPGTTGPNRVTIVSLLTAVDLTLRYCELQQRRLWQTLGPSLLSRVFSGYRAQFTDIPHDRWLRTQRDKFLGSLPAARIGSADSLVRFLAHIREYVDIAVARVAADASGTQCVSRDIHASAVDVIYWLLNKGPGSIAHATDRLAARLDLELRAHLPNHERRDILLLLPNGHEPMEVVLQRSCRALLASEEPAVVEGARSNLLFFYLFDSKRIERSPNSLVPADSCVDELALEHRRLIQKANLTPRMVRLIDVYYALVYANVRLEAQFGFRAWPGLANAAARRPQLGGSG